MPMKNSILEDNLKTKNSSDGIKDKDEMTAKTMDPNKYFVLPKFYLFNVKYEINEETGKLEEKKILNPAEMSVLFAIASFGQNCAVYPSEACIAMMAGCSVSTVKTTITKLVSLGYLEVIQRYKDTNIYKLVDFDAKMKEKGYILVSKDIFHKNSNLNSQEKIAYCAFCVLAGNSNKFKMDSSKIMGLLGIEINTFSKHKNSLINKEYIEHIESKYYYIAGRKLVPNKKENINKNAVNKDKKITKSPNLAEKKSEKNLENVDKEDINSCNKVYKNQKENSNKAYKNDSPKECYPKSESQKLATRISKIGSQKLATNNNYINIINKDIDNNNLDESGQYKNDISNLKEEILEIIDSIYPSLNKNNEGILYKTIKNLKDMIKNKKPLNINNKTVTVVEIFNCLKNKGKEFFNILINATKENIEAITFEKMKKGGLEIKNEKAYYYSTIWNTIKELEETLESIEKIKESRNYKEIPTFEEFLKDANTRKIPEISVELNDFYSKNDKLANKTQFKILAAKAYIKIYFNHFVDFTSNLKDFYYFSLDKEYAELEKMVTFIKLKCGDTQNIQALTQGFADLSDDSKKIYYLVRYNIEPINGELSYMEREIVANFFCNYDMEKFNISRESFENLYSEDQLALKYTEFLKDKYSSDADLEDLDLRLVRNLYNFDLFLNLYITSKENEFKEQHEKQMEIYNYRASVYSEMQETFKTTIFQKYGFSSEISSYKFFNYTRFYFKNFVDSLNNTANQIIENHLSSSITREKMLEMFDNWVKEFIKTDNVTRDIETLKDITLENTKQEETQEDTTLENVEIQEDIILEFCKIQEDITLENCEIGENITLEFCETKEDIQQENHEVVEENILIKAFKNQQDYEIQEENIELEKPQIQEEMDLKFVFSQKLDEKTPCGMTFDEFLDHVGADKDNISRENYLFVSDALLLYDAKLKSREDICLEFDRYIENLVKKLNINSTDKAKVNKSEAQEINKNQNEVQVQEETEITGKTKIIKNLSYDMVNFILKNAVSTYFKNNELTESEFIEKNNLKLSGIWLNPVDFAHTFNNQDKFESVGVYVKLYVQNYILELINEKSLEENYCNIPQSFITKMLENELNEQLDYKRLTLSSFIESKEFIIDFNAFIESFENQDKFNKIDEYAKEYAKNAVIELSEKDNVGFFKRLFTQFKNNTTLTPNL